MAEVVRFPEFDQRKLAEVVAIFRSALSANGADAHMVDWISENLRSRIRAADVIAPFPLNLPSDIHGHIDEEDHWFRRMASICWRWWGATSSSGARTATPGRRQQR
jgi:hypothetical protein